MCLDIREQLEEKGGDKNSRSEQSKTKENGEETIMTLRLLVALSCPRSEIDWEVIMHNDSNSEIRAMQAKIINKNFNALSIIPVSITNQSSVIVMNPRGDTTSSPTTSGVSVNSSSSSSLPSRRNCSIWCFSRSAFSRLFLIRILRRRRFGDGSGVPGSSWIGFRFYEI